MLLKIPARHASQLERVDASIHDELSKVAADTAADVEQVLEKLTAISEQHTAGSTSLELAVHIRRRVLSAQWNYLSHHSAPSHLVRRVIDELDVIGYEHPANWADIRLELAAQYERESNHEDALAVRSEVRGEVRRVVSELQLLKHV